MKKFYSLMTLALGVGLTAQAVAPMTKELQKSIPETLLQAQKQRNSTKAQKASKPAKIASVSDLAGNYGITFFAATTNTDVQALPLVITPGEADNEIILEGLYFQDAKPVATVDLEQGLVILKVQELFYDTQEGVSVWLQPGILNDKGGWDMVDEVAGLINPDGSIDFTDYNGIFLAGGSPDYYQGFYWGAQWLICHPIFELNQEEWESKGTAMFKDAWVLPAFGEEAYNDTPMVAVELMEHKNIPGEYVLVNPYDSGDLKQFIEEGFDGYTQPGAIRFNVADPEFAYVIPFTPSGAVVNLNNPDQEPLMQEFYDFNYAGYYKAYGFDTDLLYDFFLQTYLDAAVEDWENYQLSYLDEATKSVYIYGPFFGFTSEPLSFGNYNISNWSDPDTIIYAQINLDPEAGVGSIEASDENAPVKYYTLQGYEITNPAKGQLVIKKQGSKSVKFIAK